MIADATPLAERAVELLAIVCVGAAIAVGLLAFFIVAAPFYLIGCIACQLGLAK